LDELNRGGLTKRFTGDEPVFGVILGSLLLDGYVEPRGERFSDAVLGTRNKTEGRVHTADGKTKPKSVVYEAIAKQLPRAAGRPPSDPVMYQELAFVSRQVIDDGDVPLGHPGFNTKLAAAAQSYMDSSPLESGLEIPPVTRDGPVDESKRENIHAVAMVFAAYWLEQAALFHVVDRITENFMNGLLPIGYGEAGKVLDEHYWNNEDRMSEAARRMQYTRCLGVEGGEVSREVQPNAEFGDLWLRFLASLAEYNRQQRIGDFFDKSSSPMAVTGEGVRKAGRDLAANCSLYGYAYTHFAARRLKRHIEAAWRVLDLREIRDAYGVNNPWEVVERVATTELNMTPNAVRFSTLADSGKRILDIVAKYAGVWNGSPDGAPLFMPPEERAALAAVLDSGDGEFLPSAPDPISDYLRSEDEVREYRANAESNYEEAKDEEEKAEARVAELEKELEAAEAAQADPNASSSSSGSGAAARNRASRRKAQAARDGSSVEQIQRELDIAHVVLNDAREERRQALEEVARARTALRRRSRRKPSDIHPDDEGELLRNVELILASEGYPTAQVDELAQARQTPLLRNYPGRVQAPAAAPADESPIKAQLRQMVASGQIPQTPEIQRMLNGGVSA
jgi:cell division septum initiation protein DivIVA